MLATCFSLWCHKIQKVTLWTKERKRDALGSNHPATLRLKLTLTRPPKVCAKQIYVVSRLQWFGLRNKSKRAASTSRRVNYSQPSAPQSHNQTFGERPEDKQTLQFHLPNRSKRGPSNQRMARQHGVDSSYHCLLPTPPITVEEAAYVGSLHECHVSAMCPFHPAPIRFSHAMCRLRSSPCSKQPHATSSTPWGCSWLHEMDGQRNAARMQQPRIPASTFYLADSRGRLWAHSCLMHTWILSFHSESTAQQLLALKSITNYLET